MRLINLVFSMVLALVLTGCSNKDKEDHRCSTATEDDAKIILVPMALQLPNIPPGSITRSLSRVLVQLPLLIQL